MVDDQPKIRRFIRATLVADGYEVDEARTGEEALEKIREFRPGLVLLDINMPGMNGLGACREIRRDTDIGIIMLTVRNSEEDKVAALDAGATILSPNHSAPRSFWHAFVQRSGGSQLGNHRPKSSGSAMS